MEYLDEDEDEVEYAPVIKKTRPQPKRTTKTPVAPKTTKVSNSSAMKATVTITNHAPLAQSTKPSSLPGLTPIKANKTNLNTSTANDLPKILLDDPENAYGLHIAQQMRQFASFEREILRNKINNMVFTAFIEYQKRKKE